MPIYQYKCAECTLDIEIMRSITDYAVVPTKAEVKELHLEMDLCREHIWKKQLGVATMVRGPNWNGSKGNW